MHATRGAEKASGCSHARHTHTTNTQQHTTLLLFSHLVRRSIRFLRDDVAHQRAELLLIEDPVAVDVEEREVELEFVRRRLVLLFHEDDCLK